MSGETKSIVQFGNKRSDQLTDEDRKTMSAKMGMDMSTFQKFLNWAGTYAPLVYDAIVKLVELLNERSPDGGYAAVGHHCPEELKKVLCEAEFVALHSLAYVMHARHMACCEGEHELQNQKSEASK